MIETIAIFYGFIAFGALTHWLGIKAGRNQGAEAERKEWIARVAVMLEAYQPKRVDWDAEAKKLPRMRH